MITPEAANPDPEENMKLIALLAAAVAALVLAAPTQAMYRLPHHKTFSSMSVTEKRNYLARQVWHDKTALRWLHQRPPRALATAKAADRYRSDIVWFSTSLRIAGTHLRQIDRALAQARAPVQSTSGFPPHHALWVCISRYEGSPTSVNSNGHYGMLQMTWNWMGQIKGAASNYPQAVQEWAAERAWAANHYSYSFLYGQWYEWDAADGCGTTG